ncbi:hypothetical protein HDU97_007153 [Phlyctochytrium planicorne]|nr:hypothetical protein HDU97_007153 [Phlyctochytrium planicorne]
MLEKVVTIEVGSDSGNDTFFLQDPITMTIDSMNAPTPTGTFNNILGAVGMSSGGLSVSADNSTGNDTTDGTTDSNGVVFTVLNTTVVAPDAPNSTHMDKFMEGWGNAAANGPVALLGTFFFIAILMVPGSIVIFFFFLTKKNRVDGLEPSPLMTYLAWGVLVAGLILVLFGFITGIRGNSFMTQSFNEFRIAFEDTAKEAERTASNFTNITTDALQTMTTGMVNVLQLMKRDAVNTSGIADTLYGSTYTPGMDLSSIDLGTASPAIELSARLDIVTKGANSIRSAALQLALATEALNSIIGDVIDKTNALNQAVASLNLQITPTSGRAFKLLNSVPVVSSAIVSNLESLRSYIAPLATTSPASSRDTIPRTFLSTVVSTLFDQSTSYLTLAGNVSQSLKGITTSVNRALDTRVDATLSIISPVLLNFTSDIADKASKGQNQTLAKIGIGRDYVGTLFNSTQGGLNTMLPAKEGMFVLLFVLAIMFAVGVIVLAHWRFAFGLKFAFFPVAVLAIIFLTISFVFFMVNVIVTDICNIPTAAIGNPNMSSLVNTPYAYAPKLFHYRQTGCLDEDLGWVRFGVNMGVVHPDVGNLTNAAVPMVQLFRYNLLMGLTLKDLFTSSGDVLLTDPMTPRLQYLQTNYNTNLQYPVSNIQTLNFDSAVIEATTLSGTLNILIQQINTAYNLSPNGLSTITQDIAPSTGATWTDVKESLLSSLVSSQQQADDVRLTLMNVTSSLQSAKATAQQIADSLSNMMMQYPRILERYAVVKPTITNFLTEATKNLTSYAQGLNLKMLDEVEKARQQFENNLPCKAVSMQSFTFQTKLCGNAVNSIDYAWLSLWFVGLALLCYTACYGPITNRIAHRKKVAPEPPKQVGSPVKAPKDPGRRQEAQRYSQNTMDEDEIAQLEEDLPLFSSRPVTRGSIY